MENQLYTSEVTVQVHTEFVDVYYVSNKAYGKLILYADIIDWGVCMPIQNFNMRLGLNKINGATCCIPIGTTAIAILTIADIT